MPIKRPKSTATPGNPIEVFCDNCPELISQGETEAEAIENAEKRGADVVRFHGDWIIVCKSCLNY